MQNVIDSTNARNHFYLNHDGSLSLKKALDWNARNLVLSLKSYLQPKLVVIQLWIERVNSRRILTHQSDYILEDMGLTRADVQKEVNKWFWQS